MTDRPINLSLNREELQIIRFALNDFKHRDHTQPVIETTQRLLDRTTALIVPENVVPAASVRIGQTINFGATKALVVATIEDAGNGRLRFADAAGRYVYVDTDCSVETNAVTPRYTRADVMTNYVDLAAEIRTAIHRGEVTRLEGLLDTPAARRCSMNSCVALAEAVDAGNIYLDKVRKRCLCILKTGRS